MSEAPVRRFDIGDDESGIDPDFKPTVVSTSSSNPLDALRETITAQVAKPDLTLQVITRPGMTIRFSTNIDLESIQRWRRASHDKSQPDNFNILKFGSLVIANTAMAFALNGDEPTGADGDTLSFRSAELLAWTNTKRPLDAVRALYDNDGHIVATAQEVMEAAGYGDEMMEADEGPTKRS